MFGKSKKSEPLPAAPAVTPAGPEDKKGRPTPKRRVAESANQRPLVVADRKAARKAESSKAREQRALEQQALNTGDEKHMPLQHRGPERAFARQYVDARFSVGELMMPVLLFIIVLTFAFSRNVAMVQYLTIAMYGFIAILVIDLIFLRARLKKAAIAKFGDFPRGLGAYAMMRAAQFRRLRLPKAITKRGDYPSF